MRNVHIYPAKFRKDRIQIMDLAVSQSSVILPLKRFKKSVSVSILISLIFGWLL